MEEEYFNNLKDCTFSEMRKEIIKMDKKYIDLHQEEIVNALCERINRDNIPNVFTEVACIMNFRDKCKSGTIDDRTNFDFHPTIFICKLDKRNLNKFVDTISDKILNDDDNNNSKNDYSHFSSLVKCLLDIDNTKLIHNVRQKLVEVREKFNQNEDFYVEAVCKRMSHKTERDYQLFATMESWSSLRIQKDNLDKFVTSVCEPITRGNIFFYDYANVIELLSKFANLDKKNIGELINAVTSVTSSEYINNPHIRSVIEAFSNLGDKLEDENKAKLIENVFAKIFNKSFSLSCMSEIIDPLIILIGNAPNILKP